jgi:catechol 2,3-dioxygenase-like lactoylglutathione lyase family enzyme
MRLHHLAVLTPDPVPLAAWWSTMLGLVELRRQTDAAGVRSVWLGLDGGVILMIERGERREPGRGGWDGVYFAADPGSGAYWRDRLASAGTVATGQTAHTLYGADPDGNRFGLSSWPEGLFAG